MPKGAVFCAECGKKLTEGEEVKEDPIRNTPIDGNQGNQNETTEIPEASYEDIEDGNKADASFERIVPIENNYKNPHKSKNSSKPKKKKTTAMIIGACVVVLAIVVGVIFAHNNQEDEYVSDNDTEYDYESYDEDFDDEIDEYEKEFQEETNPAVNLEISDSGYTIFKPDYSDVYEVSYGVEIKNKSSKKTEKRLVTIKATARDKNNSVIDTDEEYFAIEVPPQKTTCVGKVVMYLEEEPNNVDFELSYYSDPIFRENVSTVEVSEIKMKEKDGFLLISGDLINNTKKDYAYGTVYLIYKRDNGIVGGTEIYVEPAKKGKNSFSEEIFIEEKISDKYDIYSMAAE